MWVGYDNGDGKRRSLGTTATGARIALPIFEPILQAVGSQGIAPKAPLSGPSPEAKRYLEDLPIDYMSGSRGKRSGQSFVEHFRVGSDGKIRDTNISLRRISRLRDDARHSQIQAREKALGGGVLLRGRLNEEAMALGC